MYYILSLVALALGYVVGEWTGIIVVAVLIFIALLFAKLIRSNPKTKPAYNITGDSSQSDAGAALLIPLVALGEDTVNDNSSPSAQDHSVNNESSGGFWAGVQDFFSGDSFGGGGDSGGYSGGDSGGGGDGGGGGGGD